MPPPRSPPYRPRSPHDTFLHRLVREHYETYVAHTRATYVAPLPRYLTDAFERYLTGGDFSRGFVGCCCDACRHDVLVPFSCNPRDLARAAARDARAGEAANVTDRILPSVPVRQWVTSLPPARDPTGQASFGEGSV